MKNNSENIQVRINGRGNAWPVFLGGSSNFYDPQSSTDLSNASFSLISTNSEQQTNWEILIDAGHHTVPFLINNGNRIPEAIVLTHGHMDHALGIDWVAQSRYYLSGKKLKYPLYATLPVWEFVKQSYPHLVKIIDFKELLAGVQTSIDEVDGLVVTAYPVYHGQSAKGASMLFFVHESSKSALFTGDMLCPLIRKKDYKTISQAQAVFIDSNNCFPYPLSNHGSISKFNPNTEIISMHISDWQKTVSMENLIAPQERTLQNQVHNKYFEEVLSDFNSPSELPLSIIDFVKMIQIRKVGLVHYGAMEDKEFYEQEQLTTNELQEWANNQAIKEGLSNIDFFVPETGDLVYV